MTEWSTYAWIGFNVFVAAMLVVDLGIFHRDAKPVRFREAMGWSVVWIALALLFTLGFTTTPARSRRYSFSPATSSNGRSASTIFSFS